MFWLACTSTDAGTDPPDLSAVLVDEARAGVIHDPAVLFAGISADGREGDILLYNDRVRFVVRGVREGDFYIQQGGGITDADIVRPDGQLGREAVDAWREMIGLGHLLEAESVTVMEDGRAGGPAVVRVEGYDTAMELATGSLEAPELIPDEGLAMRTDYVLEPGSSLLKVITTVTATDHDVRFGIGDILQASLDAGTLYAPGEGYEVGGSTSLDWIGWIADRDDLAYGIFATPDSTLNVGGLAQILQGAAELVAGFSETLDIAEGESATWTRYYGVGASLGELSDAWMALDGEHTTLEVDAGAPGVRVSVTADGLPFTVGLSGDDGRVTLTVPVDAAIDHVLDGRGRGLYFDLPAGHGSWSGYASEPVQARVLESLASGAVPVLQAQGRGWSATSLPEPASLVVSGEHSFEIRLYSTAKDDADPALVRDTPGGGATAIGWAPDGDVTVALAPGEYSWVAWAGLRNELDTGTLTVSAGEDATLTVDTPLAYGSDWSAADLHVHAAPSGDGGIPLEERVVVMASLGLDIFVATDHDHVTDYSPLVEVLGLDIASVVGVEVSPVLGGHVNAWPVVRDPEATNGGAWLWWANIPDSAEAWFSGMRDRWPDALLQINHPTDGGFADMAQWTPGSIGAPERWSEDFDAVEVLNSGDWSYADFWWDCFARGVLAAPVGVSDSHTHTSGSPGLNVTLYKDDLAASVSGLSTVVSLGPTIEQDPPPGTVIGPTTLSVQALSPSWIAVDTLTLYRDGEAIESVAGTTASFELSPDEDAAYTVVATGTEPMTPLFGDLPFAMSAPVMIDVDDDGWDPPLPAFTYEAR